MQERQGLRQVTETGSYRGIIKSTAEQGSVYGDLNRTDPKGRSWSERRKDVEEEVNSVVVSKSSGRRRAQFRRLYFLQAAQQQGYVRLVADNLQGCVS